jgi:hypothetical protein
MPTAPLRFCLEPGCSNLVPSGRCGLHQRQANQRRGSAASRGYNALWRHFRAHFLHLLIEAHVTPVCGAVLPGGPQTQDSQCKTEGLLTGVGLELDHEPPLTDHERHDPRAVCNPLRIQLLCGARCHPAKTRRDQQHR